VAKVKVIARKAPEETKEKLRRGETSINRVYQELKEEIGDEYQKLKEWAEEKKKIKKDNFDERRLILGVIHALLSAVGKWPTDISLRPLIDEVRIKLDHIEKRRKAD
jgi:hypothetical protein